MMRLTAGVEALEATNGAEFLPSELHTISLDDPDDIPSASQNSNNSASSVSPATADLHVQVNDNRAAESMSFKSNRKPLNRIFFNTKNPTENYSSRSEFPKLIYKTLEENKGTENIILISQSHSEFHHIPAGIGKTEVVLQYIHQHRDIYQHVVIIDAQDPSMIEAQFKRLASQKLKIPVLDANHKSRLFDDILEEIYEILLSKHKVVTTTSSSSLLLVFDNVKDPNEIYPFLPSHDQLISRAKPFIIVTSRNSITEDDNTWTSTENQKFIHLTLTPWNDDECYNFLRSELNLLNTLTNKRNASKLGEILGGIPLALQLAAVVIREKSKLPPKTESSKGIENLIDDLQQGLLAENANTSEEDPTTTSNPLLVLWNMLQREMLRSPQGPLTLRVLNFLAYLSPLGVPESLIMALVEDDDDNLTSALQLLLDFCIVVSTDDSNTKVMKVHRMIQEFTRRNLQSYSRQSYLQKIFQQLKDYLFNYQSSWNLLVEEASVLTELTTGVQAYIELIEDNDLSDAIIANIITLADYLIEQEFLEEYGEFLHLVGVRLKDHRTATAENYFLKLSKYFTDVRGVNSDQAQENLREMMSIDRSRILWNQLVQSIKSDSIKFFKQIYKGSSLNNDSLVISESETATLAELKTEAMDLINREKYEEAMRLYIKALDVDLEGDEIICPNPTVSLIADLLQLQGQLDEALKVLKKILKVQQNCICLGKNHLWTINTMNNIAKVYEEQGCLDNAIEIYREVLGSYRRDVRQRHLEILSTQGKIAALLQCLGQDQGQRKYEDIRDMYLTTVLDMTRELGHQHPSTLNAKTKLCLLYSNYEIYHDAERIAEEVVSARWKSQVDESDSDYTFAVNLLKEIRSKMKRVEIEPLVNDLISLI